MTAETVDQETPFVEDVAVALFILSMASGVYHYPILFPSVLLGIIVAGMWAFLYLDQNYNIAEGNQ